MVNEEISFIIPTLNRTDYVRRLLASIKRQRVLPAELLIVDGGPGDISDTLKDFNELNIRYLRTGVPSLTKQKNTGIANLGRHAVLVGFIDDDIVFEENSLKNMMDFWRAAGADIGGVSFNAINNNFAKANIIERVFWIGSYRAGELLKSGFNTQISSIDATRCAGWLFGGITVWRRRVVDEFKFDEWFTGNAFCDDIDYSYRVGRKYKMMVVKEAEVMHLSQPLRLDKEYHAASAQARNRIYFVKKHKEFSLFLCYWAHFGLCLKNLFSGILTHQPRYLLRAMGILNGIFTAKYRRLGYDDATIKRYSFLWSKSFNAPSKGSHFDSMQEVISDKIVRGAVGLDLGCGRGQDTFYMAQNNSGTRIIGLDISKGVYAAARLNSAVKNAVIIRGSASGIPLKSRICDFVYSFGVLHHMYDYKKGFREIHRVLKEQSPVFLYLYEDHSDNPVKFFGIKIISAIRKFTVRMPPEALFFLTLLISPLIVMLFSYPAKVFKRFRRTYKLYEKWPFNFGNSLFSLRCDLYDRFGAPVENRFNKNTLRAIFQECNFSNVNIAKLNAAAGWVAWAYKEKESIC